MNITPICEKVTQTDNKNVFLIQTNLTCVLFIYKLRAFLNSQAIALYEEIKSDNLLHDKNILFPKKLSKSGIITINIQYTIIC